MAVIFQLWAECKDEESLDKLKVHFDGLEYTLLNGRTLRFSTSITEIPTNGLIVESFQIGKGRGIENLNDALEATEVGMFFYSCLRTAPDFRFTSVGWDVENSYTSNELSECVRNLEDGRRIWNGFECVINDELYKELGSPIQLWRFADKYWWSKFSGESYMPLFSDDQNELLELCEKLLPNNFDRSSSG